MNRRVFGGIAALLLSATMAQAQGPYHSSGIQLFGAPLVGVYKYPAGSGGQGYGYGYSPPPGYGYGPGPMSSPGGGCWGSGGAGYGYGYPPPNYGYGQPQAGIITGIGGVLEALRALKEIRDFIDQWKGGGGGPSDPDFKKLQADLAALKAQVDALKFPPNVLQRLDDIDQKLNNLSNVELKKIDDRLRRLEGKPG